MYSLANDVLLLYIILYYCCAGSETLAGKIVEESFYMVFFRIAGFHMVSY